MTEAMKVANLKDTYGGYVGKCYMATETLKCDCGSIGLVVGVNLSLVILAYLPTSSQQKEEKKYTEIMFIAQEIIFMTARIVK